jgi:peptidoglycan/LPS O-acetylase OafA/YrhL
MDNPKARLTISSLFSGSLVDLMHPPQGQIPYLDGLRTIAILLVINGHLSGQFAQAYGANRYSHLPFVADGWIGVDLFFILSGFFIGGQLWKEVRRTRNVNVGRFILRRGFRIWPLYFFTFLCVFLWHLASGQSMADKQYGWSDIVFLTNYHNRGIVLGSWSLCTEEQFYIVTPIALFIFASHLPQLRNFRPWLWALLISVTLLRAAIWIFFTGHFFVHDTLLFAPLYYASITHCDGLIMGLIIANLWAANEQPRSRFASPGLLVLYGLAITVVLNIVQREIFDFFVLALLFGAFTWLGLQRPIAIFNSRIFYWISRLSFGMYLNHEYMIPFAVRCIGGIAHSMPALFAHFSVVANLLGVALLVLFSAVVSLVTFCCVEHPFLQARKVVLGH